MREYRNFFTINRLSILLAVALAYLVTARLGLLLALQPGFATSFWPPSGIAVAALLLFGYEIWPAIFIGSFTANLLTSAPSVPASLLISTAIGIGSALQALAICYLLRTLTNSVPHLLNTRRNIISFLLFTPLGCLISSTIGVTTLTAMGIVPFSQVVDNWSTWWLGDITGIYIFAPFIFAWSKPFDRAAFLHRLPEELLVLALTLAISIICFGGWLNKGYPLEYLLMPCLIWSLFRFNPHLTTTFLVLIAIITVVGTAHGYGPFVQSSLNESLLLLQLFLAVIAATTLILISAINEIWHSHEVLEQYSHELKIEVKNRTTALQIQTQQFQETTINIQDQTAQLQEQVKELEKKSQELSEENRQLKERLEK